MKVFYRILPLAAVLIFSFNRISNAVRKGPPDDLLNFSSHDSSVRPQSNFYLFANGIGSTKQKSAFTIQLGNIFNHG